MRTDQNESAGFTESKKWDQQKYLNNILEKASDGISRYRANSFSGRELNQFFLNRGGKQFCNLSSVSAVDSTCDGRAFAVLDFDNDGWQDIALVSTNRPRFQLFRNQMGQLSKRSGRILVRLDGGNCNDSSNSDLACRDGIGATLEVMYQSGKSRKIHCQSGEGNVSQNSSLIWIGVPENDTVVRIGVNWTSGNKSVVLEPSKKSVNLVIENEKRGILGINK